MIETPENPGQPTSPQPASTTKRAPRRGPRSGAGSARKRKEGEPQPPPSATSGSGSRLSSAGPIFSSSFLNRLRDPSIGLEDEDILNLLGQAYAAEGDVYNDCIDAANRFVDAKYAGQAKVDVGSVFDTEALEFYADHPVEFIEDCFLDPRDPDGVAHLVLQDWQKEICVVLADDRRGYVTVRAGSGVGKSWLLSKIIYWFLVTRPNGKVLCTAPTEHQLFDVIWKNLREDFDQNPWIQALFTWTQTKVFVTGFSATWHAVARTATARKDGKVQEGLQGFHDDNVLVIVDEASGVADSAMAAVDGALTGLYAKILLTSNPTRLSGRFYNSHRKSSIAQGGPWYTVHVSCVDNPHVSQKWVAEQRREHGEESPVFYAKILGEFPLQESNALIAAADFDVAWKHLSVLAARVAAGMSAADKVEEEAAAAGVDVWIPEGVRNEQQERDKIAGFAAALSDGRAGSPKHLGLSAIPGFRSLHSETPILYSDDDVRAFSSLGPQRYARYSHPVFGSEEAELACLTFFAKVGFKGLIRSGASDRSYYVNDEITITRAASADGSVVDPYPTLNIAGPIDREQRFREIGLRPEDRIKSLKFDWDGDPDPDSGADPDSDENQEEKESNAA